MIEIFPGYDRLSNDSINSIWDKGIICFDANVLLNLYRYSEDTRNAILDLIEKLDDKIWLPHQAALEYNRNRYEVISDQEKTYNDFLKKITQIENDLKSKSKPPFLSDDLHSNLKKVFKEVNDEVEGSIKKYNNFLKDDPIYTKVSDIFRDKISGKFDEERLDTIFIEGIERFKKKIPPGFEDEKTKDGNKKFGDLVLWKQIVEKAKNEKKSIILITDERKIDWWWKLKDGRNMGPRQELVEELKKESGNDFHMYSSERFLSFGSDYFKEHINKKALEEIKEIKRAEVEELKRVSAQAYEESNMQEEQSKKEKQEKTIRLKISSTRDQISRIQSRMKLLKETSYDESNNQDEIISYKIDLDTLQNRLFILEDRKSYLERIYYKKNEKE